MNFVFKKDRLRLFLWIGFAWFLLWEFNNLANYPTQFLPRTINELWRIGYIIAINFIFFEYTIPFITQKRGNIFIHILLALFVIWVQLMFYSFGLYAWRALGIGLGIYTPFRSDSTINHGVTYQFQSSVASIF